MSWLYGHMANATKYFLKLQYYNFSIVSRNSASLSENAIAASYGYDGCERERSSKKDREDRYKVDDYGFRKEVIRVKAGMAVPENLPVHKKRKPFSPKIRYIK